MRSVARYQCPVPSRRALENSHYYNATHVVRNAEMNKLSWGGGGVVTSPERLHVRCCQGHFLSISYYRYRGSSLRGKYKATRGTISNSGMRETRRRGASSFMAISPAISRSAEECDRVVIASVSPRRDKQTIIKRQ